jgi:hypothetical protein
MDPESKPVLVVGGTGCRPIKVRTIPWPVLGTAAAVIGRFSDQVKDMGAMLRYFQTGRYVADTQRQAEVFGTVPTAEDAVERLLRDAGLGPQPQG